MNNNKREETSSRPILDSAKPILVESSEIDKDVDEIIKKEDNNKPLKPFYKTVTFYIVTAILLCVVVFNMLFCFAFVVGDSMNPTLHDSQFVFARRSNSDLHRFDIVIIKPEGENNLIKRVIGLPNETVEYKDQKLYINGEVVEDKYGFGNTTDFSVTLDDTHYFCLGDNREYSADSRVYGPFNIDDIYAKIIKGGE